MPTPLDYVARGWAIVPFARGLKGPEGVGYSGWNKRERCVTDPSEAAKLTEQVGLAHAYSGTCAIDVDDLEGAAKWLLDRGIDLNSHINAPCAVKISSGRLGRAKLLYRLSTPLRSKKITAPGDPTKTLLEFRCATSKGTTVQDVLPPSVHPITNQPYVWEYNDELVGDWATPPELPADIRALWQSLIAPPERVAAPAPQGARVEEIRAKLAMHNPDATYDGEQHSWINIGMMLHHESAGEDWGLDLWNEWSSHGSKYQGIDDLETHWRSFGDHPNPVTIASLRVERAADPSDFDGVAAPERLANANRARFEPIEWVEFSNEQLPDWIVRDVLLEGEIGVVYGDSGSGKTFWTLDITCAIARGVPWRDKKVKQGRVVYVIAEGARGFRKRLRAYAQQNQVSNIDEMPLLVVPNAPNLLEGDQALELAKAIVDSGGARVIVIDTLAATTPGGNENGGEDMGKFLAHCRGLHRATGALVLIVHHSGKDASKGARGWSGIRAGLETEIEISAVADTRVATNTKQRDEKDGSEYGFKLVPVMIGVDDENEPITSCVVQSADVPARDTSAAKRKLGDVEKIVLGALDDVAPLSGDLADVDRVLDAASERLPHDSTKRDRRREQARRALESLVADGAISLLGNKVTRV